MLITENYHRERHDSNYRDLVENKKEQVRSFFLNETRSNITYFYSIFRNNINDIFKKSTKKEALFFMQTEHFLCRLES